MLYTDEHNLVSDESAKELHFFAKSIGCSRNQFKSGVIHRYILSKQQATNAQVYGARYLPRKKLIKLVYKCSKTKLYFPKFSRR